MVVPWVGFSVSKLLAAVEPQGSAKYVAFETLLDPARMPNQKTGVLKWPYVEGLRLDEAMHPLALFATGLYGQELPPQDGAPVKLVRAVEVRLQGHQVDRQDHARRDAAADDVAAVRAEGVRLLRERQSRCTITRAGVRRPSSASAKRAGARRCRSTATAIRSRASIAGMDLDVDF